MNEQDRDRQVVMGDVCQIQRAGSERDSIQPLKVREIAVGSPVPGEEGRKPCSKAGKAGQSGPD